MLSPAQVRAALEALGETYQDIAYHCGVAESTVQRWSRNGISRRTSEHVFREYASIQGVLLDAIRVRHDTNPARLYAIKAPRRRTA